MRRLWAGVALGALIAGGCADKNIADMNLVTDVAVSVDDRPDAEGAALVGTIGATSAETVLDDRDIEFPMQREGEAAAIAVQDILAAFVGFLDGGEINGAATLTKGPATEFLQSLSLASSCGVTVQGAELGVADVEPLLVSANSYAMALPVTLRVGGTGARTFDQLVLERQGDSRWLISDLLIEGQSAIDVAGSDLSSFRRNELRLTQTAVCLGPRQIDVSYLIANSDDQPFIPTDVFIRTRDGERVDVEGGLDMFGFERLPAKTEATIDVSATVPNGFDGGELIVIAVDVDRTNTEGVTTYRERVYDIGYSSLFSDIIPSPFSTLEDPTPVPGAADPGTP